MKPTKTLKNLIASGQTLVAPGVFDGLSALLAKRAQFPILYASGGAIARSAGYPDIGLLTMTEVLSVITHIVNVTQLPVIADADTGFGNALNVQRTVKEYEKVGVAGLHIEDQTFPKRCGHLDDKSLVSIEEMCHKVKVAKKSVEDPDFVIIARTDAIAVEGFDAAIERAIAYQQAGADMIFVEAPETIEQIEAIAKRVPGPKLLNMFFSGKTPIVPIKDLNAMGYNVIIIPSDLQRAAIKSMNDALDEIKQHGNSMALADRMVSFKERELIVDTARYLKVDEDFK